MTMAVHLQFEGIRCFAEPQDAVIRPLTLLVGENSSGKTTFLALYRVAYAIANGLQTVPVFNETPFSLGAYDQIASHHPTRNGHGGSFSITICVGIGQRRYSVGTEYVSRGGQPSPRTWRLTVGELAIQATNLDDPQQGSILLEGPRGKNRVAYAGALDFGNVT